MSAINSDVDRGRDLTILQVEGVVGSEDVIDALENYYNNDPTHALLWDFSEGDIRDISQKVLEKIVHIAKSHSHKRPDGRTAFVATSDFKYGMARMYESFAELHDHPVSHGAFKSREEAVQWLLE